MSKISPCLWFDDRAEEAAGFYVEVFRGAGQPATVDHTSHYGENQPGRAGTVMVVAFTLAGMRVLALNGGPLFSFSPAVSLSVSCADQAEVDYFWDRLSAGGETSQCGWLTDRFGFSWQVEPEVVHRMTTDPDPARAARVMQAILGMTKLDIAVLERAYAA